MWKKLFGGLIAVILLILVVGLLLPSKVHVERSIVINAPPSTVFALINDFHKFNLWSPWAKLDPDTQYTFSGPDSGVGAKMAWHSENRDVGSGHHQILISKPDEHIQTALDFGDMGTAFATFDLAATDAGTRVTWGFDRDNGYNMMGRYFGLMMDKMIGPDFERGLANLKTLAESTSPETPSPQATTSAPVTTASAGLDLARKSGCLACHSVDKKVVGPAWKEVAARYKNDAQAKARLISKVKTGGKGNWTDVTGGAPMPPYSPRISDSDITLLVEFVLAL